MFSHRSKPQKNKEEGEKPFWISFADLMTALMTLFLVVMAVSLMVVTQKVNDAIYAEEQRKSEILAICEAIKAAVKDKTLSVNVDCKDNRINFGEAGRFAHNDYRLNAIGENALRQLTPIILEVANSKTGQKWFKQVVIEGFTDTDGAYLYNLNLSLRRSEWVMCLLLDPKLSSSTLNNQQQQQVKQLFLAGGVAFNNAKETKEQSRRVELRLQFYGLKEKEQTEPQLHFVSNVSESCQLAR